MALDGRPSVASPRSRGAGDDEEEREALAPETSLAPLVVIGLCDGSIRAGPAILHSKVQGSARFWTVTARTPRFDRQLRVQRELRASEGRFQSALVFGWSRGLRQINVLVQRLLSNIFERGITSRSRDGPRLNGAPQHR